MALNDRRFAFKVLLAVALVSAVGLSGCGRKGALQPPPNAKVETGDGAGEGEAAAKAASKPDRPFVLDWLL